MLITTSYHPGDAERDLARALARRLACPFVPRRRDTLYRLWRKYGPQPVLVATTEGLRLYPPDSAEPFYFHPSTAYLRVTRMLNGGSDKLVEAAGAEPGDTVLDCTAGLGADAIVFAHEVGPQGRVVALESEPLVAWIVGEGLASYQSGLEELDAAMRRIELVQADHASYLPALPDNSVDIVYFDPMFRESIESSIALSPLRKIANNRPLDPAVIREACRIARKRVVLKEQASSGEFERLGFAIRQGSKSARIAYGVIEC